MGRQRAVSHPTVPPATNTRSMSSPLIRTYTPLFSFPKIFSAAEYETETKSSHVLILNSDTVECLTYDDDDCFYIALFSTLEQTHCARM